MGYSVGGFLELAQFMRLPDTNVSRVLDLGSQDLTVFDEADLQRLLEGVTRYDGNAESLRHLRDRPFPIVVAAREAFAAMDVEYTCCDVDRRPGTIYVDFSTMAFDRKLYGQFDMVMNAGTTEHLPNPVAALFFMHYMCRKGGILHNEVPLSGWFNHGLNNLTPKFWHTLRWINSYDVLSAKIKPVDMSIAPPGNFGGDHLAFIRRLDEAGSVSSSIQVIYKKTGDRGFVPPFDAVIPTEDNGAALARLVFGSLHPFVACGSLSSSDAVATVNDFLAFQMLSYRFSDSYGRTGRTSHALQAALWGWQALPRQVKQTQAVQWARGYVMRKLKLI